LYDSIARIWIYCLEIAFILLEQDRYGWNVITDFV
jgi:hypothetical protein